MKLIKRKYSDESFEHTKFCEKHYNGYVTVRWYNKIFINCQFHDCDFTSVVAEGCKFIGCSFRRGQLQHFYMGMTTSFLHKKTSYWNCTFERVKLRNLGIADFHNCTFINCDFSTMFITASFIGCNFIGEISNCVFCGSEYSAFYGGRVNYWVSNKALVKDCDFTKATLKDVRWSIKSNNKENLSEKN